MTPQPRTSPERDLDRFLEDYTERLRRGERPTIEEYIALRPDLAEDIRLLFPTMQAMESFLGPTTDEKVVPERIGDFRVVREAGRGGMGVVYEAVQESLGRRVALKVLPREIVGDDRGLERFRREARAAARLHHTNIVPVFGVGEEEGVHYYAMQFIEGQSLDAILDEARRAQGSRPPVFPSLPGSSKDILGTAREGSSGTHSPQKRHHRAVAGVGLQVAEALAYAHAQGILHRDIKPSNLLLDAGGTVWITDFGLAKADEDGSLSQWASLTQAGDIVGTIAYLAPERLEGKSDARSDVYALGLTLYELITLQPAFQDENRRRLLKRVAEESPPLPRALDPSIPRDLETIILTAIAKEPADRYTSAARLADDLRSFLAGRPIAARRASAIERIGRWCRREPALAALGAIVIALLFTIATLSSFGYLKLSELLGVAKVSLERTQSAEGRARAELRRSYIAQARSIRVGAQPGRRFDCLDAVRRAVELGPSEEEIRALRDEAIGALSVADLRVTKRWRKQPRIAFAFAPDLESFAEADPNGLEVVLRRVSDRAEIARIPIAGATYGSLHFSPDGRYLAARLEQSTNRLLVMDVTSFETVYTSTESTFGAGLDFHPQSTLLALLLTKGAVQLLDLSKQREVARYSVRRGTHVIAFHPAGTWLALAFTNDEEIQVIEAETGRLIFTLREPFSMRDALFNESGAFVQTALAWSADGSLLAAGASDGSVRVWEVTGTTPRKRWQLPKQLSQVASLFFNHSDTMLATYSWTSMLRLCDPANGNLLLAADWWPLAFSPDDRELGLTIGSYEAGLAEIAESAICQVIEAPEGAQVPVTRLQVSPDGRFLAATRRGGTATLALFDLKARRQGPVVPVAGGSSALFSSDSGWLITGSQVGLQRWPIEPGPPIKDARAGTDVGGARFGSPETLQEVRGSSSRWISQSAGGKTVAIIGERSRAEVIVLGIDGEERTRTVLGPHVNVDRISLRPDGKYLASATWQGMDVNVWDTQTGRLEVSIPLRDNASVEYSPDGRWLAVMTPEACFLHDAATLARVRRIEKPPRGGFPGTAAFRGDGKVLAISYGRRGIQLLDSETGTPVATLEAPALLANGITFHPDGKHLYAGAEDGRIFDWDLALLHRELAALGLDWAEPSK